MSTTPAIATSGSGLPREHRAWIALYCLESHPPDRQLVLQQNEVTEDDLGHYRDSWLELRRRHQLRRRR